jgi:O-methyltransferase involved in polyketide biosynthesis
VHWIDLDLPDPIELRRKFFADSGRRRMVAASVTGEDWLPIVAQSPGPYFFVADGVLAYLTDEQVAAFLTSIKNHFPNALIALDTFPSGLSTSSENWPPGGASREVGMGV